MTSLRRTTAAALMALALGLAGCTEAPPPTSISSSGSDTPTDSTTPGSGESPTPTGSRTNSASSRPSGTSAATRSSSATPTTSPTQSGPPTCSSAKLDTAVERGSGSTGHQYALLRFTNRSAAVCSLNGFPHVQLFVGTRRLAEPAGHSDRPAGRVDLAPGKSAVSQLVNDSTCNAANSDAVQVSAPDGTNPVYRPLRMRGCTLTVDPLTRG